MFQSTYLYKVRHTLGIIILLVLLFQSTYLYKVRPDWLPSPGGIAKLFQSTYLYKVRPIRMYSAIPSSVFQSTYLYKVRRLFGGGCGAGMPVSIHVPI